jgi:dolichyl-phosphate beta-glucosyltransferase
VVSIARKLGVLNVAQPSEGCPPDAAPFLSVVIPAYNEARRLGPTLEAVSAYLAGTPHEILVVDDGSRDETSAVAGRVAGVRVLRLETNRGKGAAVRHGMLEARGEWVLMSDADLSTPIDEYDRLKEHLKAGADIAIGSRGLRQAEIEVSQPFYRVFMGKTFNLLVQALLLPGIWDTQCGFKLFSRSAARAVFERVGLSGFGFDVEAVYIAKRLGLRVDEVPVRWRNDPDTRVNAWRDSLRTFRELWGIRRTHRNLPRSA